MTRPIGFAFGVLLLMRTLGIIAMADERVTEPYQGDEQPLHGAADNGMNVLLDHAHQFQFFGAWDVPPAIRAGGFRVVSSQATLDSVLAAGGTSRVRVRQGDRRPFGWWDNASYNAVVTYQVDPNAQPYLPEEIAAVRAFVEQGGGLVMIGGGRPSEEAAERWPLNAVAAEFGARFTHRRATVRTPVDDIAAALSPPPDADAGVVQVSDAWESLLGDGDSVVARREFGKGRVLVIADLEMLKWTGVPDAKVNADFLRFALDWVTATAVPAGGSRALPREAWGGGAIYPELEASVGQVTVFYARNQPDWMLGVIRDDMPDVQRKIESWLPSAPSDEGMHLILSAGAGGGWAVNIYTPKEVGIIALDTEAILSIFAHELAHTMDEGPPGADGKIGGRMPWPYSEAHAGWFQGKVEALRTRERGGHDPNLTLNDDPGHNTVDLAALENHGPDNAIAWRKLWWVWQKMDDRYGPTWYARWLWVKNTRWGATPEKALSWTDLVEDMSIAVGEDLFPFFRAIGTTLDREQLGGVEFLGDDLSLPTAEIELTDGGEARLEPIGDYRAPWR
ncbi:MAG: hypothetical protein ABGY41_07450 [Candidatus Poribacteria bacterium]